MNPQLREWLPTYADGELPPDRAAQLEAALRDSAELRAELERWRALRCCVNRVVCCECAPAEVSRRIRHGLAAGARRRRVLRLVSVGVATAAALVAAILVYPRVFPPPASNSPALVDSVADAPAASGLLDVSQFAMIYRRCAIENHHDRFQKHGGDPNAVRRELASTAKFPLLVPDLRSAGFELDGVCPCFPDKSVNAVHAFYRKEGTPPQIISVFSLNRCVTLRCCEPGKCNRGTPLKRAYDVARHNEVSLVKWDERGASYALAGQMESDELLRLANAVDMAAWIVPAPDSYARLP